MASEASEGQYPIFEFGSQHKQWICQMNFMRGSENKKKGRYQF